MGFMIYILFLAVCFLFLRQIFALRGRRPGEPSVSSKASRKYVTKSGRELWVQVYDTDSLEEARSLQARLEEEELDCLVYEQGRKDVRGNLLKTFGIAVPRTSVGIAQKIVVKSIS